MIPGRRAVVLEANSGFSVMPRAGSESNSALAHVAERESRAD
ncbi:MAG: hypothetical protein ACLGJB_01685 [Blastocatellia bacterium]